MKKTLRTNLKYRCDKRSDFCYINREFKTVYTRSYDMNITASTEKECQKLMDSFERFICNKSIQDCFESNLEPEIEKATNLWVGSVEIYIGNDNVAYEREVIKEAYREWKELVK